GTALGIAASRKVNSLRDALISIFALLTFATPVFWLGLMLIVLFAVQLGWLPSSGMETVGAGYQGFARMADIGRHMALPVLTLALFFIA
ncbi:ABC transporter permease subunit, partial [Streptomyces turgidiscabies]|uniref:ABC transporter permease subunit n=1 Tax=Streptomyces turgidiscabies TaxID=85558 RepID=UPI0038F801F2